MPFAGGVVGGPPPAPPSPPPWITTFPPPDEESLVWGGGGGGGAKNTPGPPRLNVRLRSLRDGGVAWVPGSSSSSLSSSSPSSHHRQPLQLPAPLLSAPKPRRQALLFCFHRRLSLFFVISNFFSEMHNFCSYAGQNVNAPKIDTVLFFSFFLYVNED